MFYEHIPDRTLLASYESVTASYHEVSSRDVFFGTCRYLTKELPPVASRFSFNYLGRFPLLDNSPIQPLLETFQSTFSPAYKRTNEVDFVAFFIGAELRLGVKYPTIYYETEKMQEFMAFLQSTLARLVESLDSAIDSNLVDPSEVCKAIDELEL
jgi:non-ribosomal peptide synthase protein (TIGR01720 family)